MSCITFLRSSQIYKFQSKKFKDYIRKFSVKHKLFNSRKTKYIFMNWDRGNSFLFLCVSSISFLEGSKIEFGNFQKKFMYFFAKCLFIYIFLFSTKSLLSRIINLKFVYEERISYSLPLKLAKLNYIFIDFLTFRSLIYTN